MNVEMGQDRERRPVIWIIDRRAVGGELILSQRGYELLEQLMSEEVDGLELAAAPIAPRQ